MDVTLRPLRDDEFAAFLDASRIRYAQDLEAHGGLPRDAARTKAQNDFATLFPGDRPSEAQIVLVVEGVGGGGAVGRVWFTEREAFGRRVAWLYEIEMAEQYRGRGLGRSAMLAFERLVRDRGVRRTELNVFGGNAVARSLYGSLGYRERFVNMAKSLD